MLPPLPEVLVINLKFAGLLEKKYKPNIVKWIKNNFLYKLKRFS